MAKVKYNVITHGFSGKVGDLVIFSQRHGKTIVGKLHAQSGAPDPKQLAVREKFKKAVRYAKACVNDPAIKPIYALRAGGGVTSHNLAFADFFKAPKVEEIITDTYSGAIGSTVNVVSTDDTKVTGVQLRILAADGSLIEEGTALKQGDTDTWTYTATALNSSSLIGCKIEVEAKDMPGNVTKSEKVL